ncbi:MAG: DNA polymerase I [Spirochaetes bacterium]|nr:DNA polymerase I [Spirochaetota bacterium]
MDNHLYIIDGHGLVYRAYYAFIRRPLVTTSGENTQAVFGFMRMVMKLVNEHHPSYLVCVFDSKQPTFRHELYPDYKAKRLKAPEDLVSQVETIKTLVPKLGMASVEAPGYEADDLIGTIIKKARAAGMSCTIVSSDKDLLQLVCEEVEVHASKKGISETEIFNEKKVRDLWGVPPGRMTDLLALMGDQSDNIPGVRGIGQKKAVKLIEEFGGLDSLYSALPRVSDERTRSLLQEGKESAFLSKKLVTIRGDAPIDFSLADFGLAAFPKQEGIKLLAEKELYTIVEELGGEKRRPPAPEGQKRGEYRILTGGEEFESLKRRMRQKGLISIDTETTGLDPIDAAVIGVSVSIEEGEGYYFPIAASKSEESAALGEEFLKSSLKTIVEDESVRKVGQNLKFDLVALLKYGLRMRNVWGDTMVAAYLLDPGRQRYGLDDMAKELLGYETIRYEDIVKEKGRTLQDYPLSDVSRYACEDSDITLRLHNRLEEELKKNRLLSLYRDVEVPLVSVLGKMEYAGVKVDPEYLGRMSKEFGKEIGEIENRIFEIAGGPFNVRSTKQLQKVLFDNLGLPVIKRTKMGISTDESVLEALSGSYEIARFLLRHRRLTKLKSTYVDSLPSMINPATGRIHTSFNQTVTTTGRLSSARPNLQNIPIREEEGRAIRRAFVPEEGKLLVSADYSQIELRILASLSGDEVMTETFNNDGDIHNETASILFGMQPGGVTDSQRQTAKTINFSIIYGMSPFGLSKRLGISRYEAGEFIRMYFKKYRGVRDFFDETVKKAKADGYVTTVLGRIRPVEQIRSQNKNLFEAAKRIAINTPIQGTAADLIKKAMVDIDREITERSLESRMLIQVHDELLLEVPEKEEEELKSLVKRCMENAMHFEIPLKVNIASGRNWEEAH